MVLLVKKFYNKCLFFDRYRNMSINICSICLIILFLLILLFSLFVKIDFNTSYDGLVVKGEEFYVRIFLDDSSIRFIQKNSLVVDGNVIDYSIVSISDDYVIPGLRSVLLDFDLDYNMRINNNIIRLHFIEKKTIFERVKEKFYEGVK